jgi:hypothetical protein
MWFANRLFFLTLFNGLHEIIFKAKKTAPAIYVAV